MVPMAVVAALAGGAGIVTLARPDLVRRRLGIPEGEGAVYALRIVGMMLTAFGLFLAGFATMFRLASAA